MVLLLHLIPPPATLCWEGNAQLGGGALLLWGLRTGRAAATPLQLKGSWPSGGAPEAGERLHLACSQQSTGPPPGAHCPTPAPACPFPCAGGQPPALPRDAGAPPRAGHPPRGPLAGGAPGTPQVWQVCRGAAAGGASHLQWGLNVHPRPLTTEVPPPVSPVSAPD